MDDKKAIDMPGIGEESGKKLKDAGLDKTDSEDKEQMLPATSTPPQAGGAPDGPLMATLDRQPAEDFAATLNRSQLQAIVTGLLLGDQASLKKYLHEYRSVTKPSNPPSSQKAKIFVAGLTDLPGIGEISGEKLKAAGLAKTDSEDKEQMVLAPSTPSQGVGASDGPHTVTLDLQVIKDFAATLQAIGGELLLGDQASFKKYLPGYRPPSQLQPEDQPKGSKSQRNPNAQATSPKSHFESEPMGVKKATAVPGIGREGGKMLKNAGIESASQVYGQFLFLKRNEEKFCQWLKETAEIEGHNAKKCYNALKEWYDRFG